MRGILYLNPQQGIFGRVIFPKHSCDNFEPYMFFFKASYCQLDGLKSDSWKAEVIRDETLSTNFQRRYLKIVYVVHSICSET